MRAGVRSPGGGSTGAQVLAGQTVRRSSYCGSEQNNAVVDFSSGQAREAEKRGEEQLRLREVGKATEEVEAKNEPVGRSYCICEIAELVRRFVTYCGRFRLNRGCHILSIRPARQGPGRRRSLESRESRRTPSRRANSTILLATNRARFVQTEDRWPRETSPKAVYWSVMEGRLC